MEKMNLLLLPGLLNGASLFEQQADALANRVGITVADLTGSDSIAALAADALEQAPRAPSCSPGCRWVAMSRSRSCAKHRSACGRSPFSVPAPAPTRTRPPRAARS